MELVVGSFEDLEAAFYDVLYGEHQWRQVVPEASIDTAINPGATTKSYRVKDWRGRASWRSRHGQNIPTVGRTLDKNLVPMEVGSISAIFDREDARQVQFGYDESLLTDLPGYMRMACDNHVEGTVFYGDPNVNFDGWLDYTGVDRADAALNAGATSREWVDKTSDEIQFDVNNAITTVWVNSKLVHMPDVVYLPPTQYGYIASRRMSDASDKSILDYLKTNNVYTSTTGKELRFVPIRYLDDAGSGDTARMVVAETNPRNQVLPFPLPFDLLEPQLFGFDVHLYAEYKFGSFHVRYPGSLSYTDGI
jgi:hypothetical protein